MGYVPSLRTQTAHLGEAVSLRREVSGNVELGVRAAAVWMLAVDDGQLERLPELGSWREQSRASSQKAPGHGQQQLPRQTWDTGITRNTCSPQCPERGPLSMKGTRDSDQWLLLPQLQTGLIPHTSHVRGCSLPGALAQPLLRVPLRMP